jgi:hypothetical protein
LHAAGLVGAQKDQAIQRQWQQVFYVSRTWPVHEQNGLQDREAANYGFPSCSPHRFHRLVRHVRVENVLSLRKGIINMRRRPFIGSAALVGGMLLLTARPGLANIYPAKMPLPAAVAAADCIVLGKVAAIEEKTILAPPFPGATVKIEYQIAVVKVEEGLKGTRGVTEVRVAFQPPPPPPPPPPVIKPGQGPVAISRPAPFPRKTLAVGTQGCFLLKKQGDETFFRLVDSNWNDYIARSDPDFDTKMSVVKRSLKFLGDPDLGLNLKDAGDRLLTAYLLLNRYQAGAGPKAKAEPIEAAQSKLILEAIAAADWSQPFTGNDPVTPQRVFQYLRLTAKEGWNAPRQGPNQDFRIFQKEWEAAAQKWLRDNAGTYRIQRWVPEKVEK